MYPLKFESICFEKIWGGNKIKDIKNIENEKKIGESWEIAHHKLAASQVVNGRFKGKTIADLIKEDRKSILGTEIDDYRLPIMIKIIDSNKDLSVQVHPSDSYAFEIEKDRGKDEAWYILDAEENAEIIVGVKEGVSKKKLKQAIQNKQDIESMFKKRKVKKGEFYFIKSGTIHALGSGIVVMEIQQNSDLTYRLWDYGRGRDLHVEKAMDVIDLNSRPKDCRGIEVNSNNLNKKYICLNKKFAIEKQELNGEVMSNTNGERFFIISCIEGSGKITSNKETVNIKYGESVLIPANAFEYKIQGDIKYLRSYVPDEERVREEIIKNIEV